MEILIAGAIGGLLLALLIMIVVWRAVGTAFDWLIETFGNDDAVRRLRERRGNS